MRTLFQSDVFDAEMDGSDSDIDDHQPLVSRKASDEEEEAGDADDSADDEPVQLSAATLKKLKKVGAVCGNFVPRDCTAAVWNIFDTFKTT